MGGSETWRDRGVFPSPVPQEQEPGYMTGGWS
jgi:hypothetical protein